MTPREEVAPGFYVFGVKHAYQVIPADTAVRLVHVENHILEVGAVCFADWRERDSWYAGELVPIVLIVTAVDGDELVYALQSRQPHRGRDFTHLAIRSDTHDFIESSEAHIPHGAWISAAESYQTRDLHKSNRARCVNGR